MTLGILISGRGSNLQAIIDAIASGELAASIAVVDLQPRRCRRPGACRARRRPHAGHGAQGVSRPGRLRRALAAALTARGVELVCLAGFMRLLGPAFVDEFPNAVLNIHPSLLPAFPGLDAQQQAFDHGVKIAGATVHFVTAELDAGPIICQAAVPVLDADTAETLAARILEAEHRLYPEGIRRVAAGGWRVVGRRVVSA